MGQLRLHIRTYVHILYWCTKITPTGQLSRTVQAIPGQLATTYVHGHTPVLAEEYSYSIIIVLTPPMRPHARDQKETHFVVAASLC